MKTTLNKFRGIILLIGLSLLFSHLHAQNDDNYYMIGGAVKNARTKRAIEYVTVSAAGTHVGTITNQDGEFILKISKDLNVTEIELSCLGYYNIKIPFSRQNILNQEFLMQPQPYPLKEVQIKSWKNAIELMEVAIEKIDNNYSQTPNLLTGFYRETAQKGRRYITVSEAVVNIYKDSYIKSTDRDKVQILKGRKLVSSNINDTLAVKLLGGPNMAIFIDVVKNPDIILDREVLHLYSYKLDESILINDRLQYVVRFSPRVAVDYILYSGTFYIDQETLAFTRAEFSMDLKDKDKVTNTILHKKPLGLRFSPEEVSYVVSYRQQDGKTYLHYLNNKIRFKCDWKRRLFATNYTVISELVITDNQKENPIRITAKDSFSNRQSLSDEAMSYFDKDFWGAYNIIEPTESLESAVIKLKKD